MKPKIDELNALNTGGFYCKDHTSQLRLFMNIFAKKDHISSIHHVRLNNKFNIAFNVG